MRLVPLEDYSTEVYLDDERDPIIIRETTPKDFYFAASLYDRESSMDPLLYRLIVNPEVLKNYSARELKKVLKWAKENVVSGSLMEIADWLSLALELSEGVWSRDLDWLEQQPFSKIRIFQQTTNEYRKRNGPKLK